MSYFEKPVIKWSLNGMKYEMNFKCTG